MEIAVNTQEGGCAAAVERERKVNVLSQWPFNGPG